MPVGTTTVATPAVWIHFDSVRPRWFVPAHIRQSLGACELRSSVWVDLGKTELIYTRNNEDPSDEKADSNSNGRGTGVIRYGMRPTRFKRCGPHEFGRDKRWNRIWFQQYWSSEWR
jgi:hypothetical protein